MYDYTNIYDTIKYLKKELDKINLAIDDLTYQLGITDGEEADRIREELNILENDWYSLHCAINHLLKIID